MKQYTDDVIICEFEQCSMLIGLYCRWLSLC